MTVYELLVQADPSEVPALICRFFTGVQQDGFAPDDAKFFEKFSSLSRREMAVAIASTIPNICIPDENQPCCDLECDVCIHRFLAVDEKYIDQR